MEYSIIKSLGDALTFYAEFTEDDDDPDAGSAETSYTVTQEALDHTLTTKPWTAVRKRIIITRRI